MAFWSVIVAVLSLVVVLYLLLVRREQFFRTLKNLAIDFILMLFIVVFASYAIFAPLGWNPDSNTLADIFYVSYPLFVLAHYFLGARSPQAGAMPPSSLIH